MTKNKTIACDSCGTRIDHIPQNCPECGEVIHDRMDPHMKERIEDKLQRRSIWRKLKMWHVLVIVLILSIYPVIYMVKGYSFASFAAKNGISVDVRIKLDGFGCGMRASKAALAKKVKLNNTLYQNMANSGFYIRDNYGAGEGLSGFFFAIGVKFGRAP